VRLGLSITSGHPLGDDRAAVRAVVDRARAAARADLDHLTLGDQHSTGRFAAYVQGVPMLGRLLAEWPPDRPAGLLFLLPLWHPVLAAEQIGTLAAMSDSRFIVQTGIGSGAAQFAAMGVDSSTRGRATDRAIAVIRGLLAGETVDAPEFGITGAAIAPRPAEPVDWWIGSGAAPAAIERAAREGDAWYVSPALDGSGLRDAMTSYREACDRFGRTPRIVLRRDVLVGDEHEATVARARTVIESGYRGLDDQVVAGGVDAVTERLATYRELGVDDVVARTITVDQDTAVRSIELLGDVRRRLRG
jgi:alkanesulfonate monooxygenase SsuD/methylene tetrahydromethanopterin reductase-like flavin-dependent oxidoreductase (luciferase family)